MANDRWHFRGGWRVGMSWIGSAPLLGWMCVGTALLIFVVYGLVSGDVLLGVVVGLGLGAIALNCCTWAAAILVGRTHHLRPSWLTLVAVLGGLHAGCEVWRAPCGDLGKLVIWALIAMGLPASLLLFVLPEAPPLPRHVNDAWHTLLLMGLAYIQAFVLLPLLFRWRAVRAGLEVDTESRTTF